MLPVNLQALIFVFLTGLIALLTFLKCRAAPRSGDHSAAGDNKEVFLAGGGLSWIVVAGSITLTNLTLQLHKLSKETRFIL